MVSRTRSKSTTVETAAKDGAVTKTVKTVEKAAPKRKAADEGAAAKRKSKKTKAAKAEKVEEEEKEEKPRAPRIPTKASAQRIPKELDPSREEPGENVSDDEEEDEDNAGVIAMVDEIDPDSDDEPAEGAETYEEGAEVPKIPTPKKGKKGKKGAEAGPVDPNASGVVYIGHIPHGFYERQLRDYLSQFGPVMNVRLSRNKKTGASKHYAFVEFTEASTADIVCKTMDNYLLFGRILKCRVIPKAQVHEDLFKGANKAFHTVPRQKLQGLELNKVKTEDAWKKKVENENKKRAKRAEALKAMGYDLEVTELKAVPKGAPMVERKVVEVVKAPEVEDVEPEEIGEYDEELVMPKKQKKKGKSRKA